MCFLAEIQLTLIVWSPPTLLTFSWNKQGLWDYRKICEAQNLSSITLLSFHRLFHRFSGKAIMTVYFACLQSTGHRKPLFNLYIKFTHSLSLIYTI